MQERRAPGREVDLHAPLPRAARGRGDSAASGGDLSAQLAAPRRPRDPFPRTAQRGPARRQLGEARLRGQRDARLRAVVFLVDGESRSRARADVRQPGRGERARTGHLAAEKPIGRDRSVTRGLPRLLDLLDVHRLAGDVLRGGDQLRAVSRTRCARSRPAAMSSGSMAGATRPWARLAGRPRARAAGARPRGIRRPWVSLRGRSGRPAAS